MQSTPDSEAKPALSASVHDVRYLSSLLRGVNFGNRATVMISENGLCVYVEEARTLLGTAWIVARSFDEFEFCPTISERLSPSVLGGEHTRPENGLDDEQDEIEIPQEETVVFEIPLNTLLECLNIFGTAGSSSMASKQSSKSKKWKPLGEDDGGDEGAEDEDGVNSNRGGSRGRKNVTRDDMADNTRIEQYFGSNESTTAVRIVFPGPGHPLKLFITEDEDGPTSAVEITTFDPEPRLELPFDSERTVLKIILKSSWLQDALSEVDPSCDQLTIIGNPPMRKSRSSRGPLVKPMLRLKANGAFGTTEMDYPNDRDVLETFNCENTVSFTYRFVHISKALRALQSSTKTCLRIDDEGLLHLQFMMPPPRITAGNKSSSSSFIDFAASLIQLSNNLIEYINIHAVFVDRYRIIKKSSAMGKQWLQSIDPSPPISM